ncbi:MAG: MFS transporter [Anaerolineae bacterium]|nr:MFS transporter [Anaerolineae bacterium]
MKRDIRWYDYITTNIYWLSLTTISQTNGLVFPLLVQQFVGEETKGTFFGTLRLWTLMVALLAQAFMGMLSDRSTLRWGRRRPFIFAGTLVNLIFIVLIGFTADMEHMTGYWALFIIAILMQVSSNAAHGALQGLIPDLVPEERRGAFSGVKAVLEVPLPIILVALFVGPIIARGNIWGGLIIAMGVMLVSMLLTMLVPEQPLETTPKKLDWEPLVRLGLMTALFTAVILGVGEVVKLAGRWLEGLDALGLQIAVVGGAGVGAMVVAVALGVWASVRVCVGTQACERNPSFTWWVVNRLAFFVGTTNLSTFAVYFLQGRMGYAEEQAAGPASQMMMIVGIFILLSALPSGWLSDRVGHKRLAMVSGVIATLGTIVLLIVPNLTIIYIGGCLIGIATGFFFTSNWALGTSLVPKEEAGRYLGISNLAGAGAGAVGAYIGGPIADYFTVNAPSHAGLGYVILFAIYAVMFFFSILALTRVHTTEK